MNIENYFKDYPLSLTDTVGLISTIEAQNKTLLPLINGTVIDYLNTEASDHEAIWSALSEIEGPLDDFLGSITVLLTATVISEVTRDSIILAINNGKRMSGENLLILDQSINGARVSAVTEISAAISKAILYIDSYYRREMQEAMPIYRYQSMLDDLRAALVLIDTIN